MSRETKRAFEVFRAAIYEALEKLEADLMALPAPSASRKRDASPDATWSKVEQAVRMKLQGHSQVQIAKLIGSSPPHVSGLLSLHRKLHPTICEAWQDGHPLAKFKTFQKLVKLSQPEQLAQWNKLTKAQRG